MNYVHTWLEISRSAFEHNINIITQIIKSAQFVCIIKAHAYGHGLFEIAQLAQEQPHVKWLCITSISEALFLRKQGISKPLLALVDHDNAYENTLECNITLGITEKSPGSALKRAEKYEKYMYGLYNSDSDQQKLVEQSPYSALKPILTWKTRIINIKTIQPDTFVGYGCTFKAQKKMTLATLSVGYSDGYPRQLSHKGSMVLLHNSPAPIIGIISMNLLTIDITHIPQACLGDEVTLLGNYPGITPQDFAAKLDTIPIEITTRINPLIKRIIV
ncbi:MAG: alanine racemase C-terminal domain-containing protein [Candidatus Babeliaceae bacterium]